MAQDTIKRHVVSYENMSEELAEKFAEKYPQGFNDYLGDLVKYPKPDGTSFYAVTIDMPGAIYLVKIKVDVDDVEDIERWLDASADEESAQITGANADTDSDGGTLPDDNISQYSGEEDQADSE